SSKTTRTRRDFMLISLFSTLVIRHSKILPVALPFFGYGFAAMQSRLANQWVLITGASSGFGAAAARAFAAQGSKLILGARRTDRLKDVAAEACKAGAPDAQFHELDVSSTPSVNAFVKWASGITGKLDVLINNAGGAHGLDTVAEGKDADWETMMQTN